VYRRETIELVVSVVGAIIATYAVRLIDYLTKRG